MLLVDAPGHVQALLHGLDARLHLAAPPRAARQDHELGADPGGAHGQHHRERDARDADRRPDADGLGVELLEHGRHLQPHGEEHEPLQQELDALPGHARGDPVLRRQLAGTAKTGDEPGHHRCHQARGAEHLGGDRGDEGQREGQRRVHGGARDAASDPEVAEAHEHTDDHGHRDRPGEAPQRLGQREAAGRGRDRGAQQHQRGGVVEQGLALQDRDHPRGHAPPGDDRGGHRVGRGEDRAQRHPPQEPEVRDEPPEQQPQQHRGEHDERDGEPADRGELPFEAHRGHGDGGRVQQRRQDHLEHHVRLELDGRHARDEARADADQHQQQRGGGAQARREDVGRADHHHGDHARGDERGHAAAPAQRARR